MRLKLSAPLLFIFLTQLLSTFLAQPALGQATPVIANVTNTAIPALDVPPASINLAPRSLGTVFGSNLADGTASMALATSLAGTELHLANDTCFDSSCELVAQLTFASPAQLNFIVPDDGSATCTTCTPIGYRIVFVRDGQRFDNRTYASVVGQFEISPSCAPAPTCATLKAGCQNVLAPNWTPFKTLGVL